MTTQKLATMTDLPQAARPTLAVVEVTRSRPDRPEYHAKVQTLNATRRRCWTSPIRPTLS